MTRALHAFAGALAYFTIFPIGGSASRALVPDSYALSFLPIVGGIVGFAAGLLGWLVAWRMPGFGGLAAWIAAIALTGAIHVDGFLDCCDGLLVTASPHHRLEILRDPGHGTFAIVGMVMLALLWVKAISALAPPALPLALAFTGVSARLAAVSNAWVFPYARRDGMQATFASRPNVAVLGAGTLLAIGLGWPFWGAASIASIALAILAALALGLFAARRLGGGITGDVYGAAVTIVEVLLLLLLAQFARVIGPVP